MSVEDIEYFVNLYGEKYRIVIIDALDYLDKKEPVWGVVLDRKKYISLICENATPVI